MKIEGMWPEAPEAEEAGSTLPWSPWREPTFRPPDVRCWPKKGRAYVPVRVCSWEQQPQQVYCSLPLLSGDLGTAGAPREIHPCVGASALSPALTVPGVLVSDSVVGTPGQAARWDVQARWLRDCSPCQVSAGG